MSGNSNLYSQGFGATSLSAAGVIPLIEQRPPTSTDVSGPSGVLKIGQQWIDQSASNVYELISIATQSGSLMAHWVSLGAAGSNLNMLTGDSGTATPVAGNINIVGGSTGYAFDGSGNTLTLTGSPNTPTFQEDTGTAMPVGGVIIMKGGTGISTSGLGNTVTISQNGTVATSYVENSGTAVPSAGVLNVTGAGTVTTAGAGNTITITGTASYPITPYVVGPVGLAPYQTIQSAINAAFGSSTSTGNVYIMPGLYAENLSLFPGVNLIGANLEGGLAASESSKGVVTVSGTTSFSSQGSVLVKGIGFRSLGGNTFAVSPSSGTINLFIEDCVILNTAGTALFINVISNSATVIMSSCTLQATAAAIQMTGGTLIAENVSAGSSGSDAVTLFSGASLTAYDNCLFSGYNSALNAQGASVINSYGNQWSAALSNGYPAVLFTTPSTMYSVNDQFSSESSTGYFVTQTSGGTFSYANAIPTGPNIAIDSVLTISPAYLSYPGIKIALQTGISNASAGAAVLSAGLVVVNTTSVTSRSLIFLSRFSPSGTLGFLNYGNVVPGSSFQISSSSASDTSTVAWMLIN